MNIKLKVKEFNQKRTNMYIYIQCIGIRLLSVYNVQSLNLKYLNGR